MRRGLVVGLALFVAGCGAAKYPVRGTVALDDGTPVTKGLVVFERADGGPPLTARGEITPDGRYELSTDKPGDGVPPGRYKVLINSMDLSEVPGRAEEAAVRLQVPEVRHLRAGVRGEGRPHRLPDQAGQGPPQVTDRDDDPALDPVGRLVRRSNQLGPTAG